MVVRQYIFNPFVKECWNHYSHDQDDTHQGYFVRLFTISNAWKTTKNQLWSKAHIINYQSNTFNEIDNKNLIHLLALTTSFLLISENSKYMFFWWLSKPFVIHITKILFNRISPFKQWRRVITYCCWFEWLKCPHSIHCDKGSKAWSSRRSHRFLYSSSALDNFWLNQLQCI